MAASCRCPPVSEAGIFVSAEGPSVRRGADCGDHHARAHSRHAFLRFTSCSHATYTLWGIKVRRHRVGQPRGGNRK